MIAFDFFFARLASVFRPWGWVGGYRLTYIFRGGPPPPGGLPFPRFLRSLFPPPPRGWGKRGAGVKWTLGAPSPPSRQGQGPAVSFFLGFSFFFRRPPWPAVDYFFFYNFFLVGGGGFFGLAVMNGLSQHRFSAFLAEFHRSDLTPIWWLTLIAMMLVPRRGFQLAGLSIVLLEMIYALVVFWHPL